MDDTTTPAERRGILLANLHAQAPHPYTDGALKKAVIFFYLNDQRQYARDLDYLQRGGVIEATNTQAGVVSIPGWQLTAKGYRVAEGTERDAGVEMPAANRGVHGS